jgi:hypothetical protein
VSELILIALCVLVAFAVAVMAAGPMLALRLAADVCTAIGQLQAAKRTSSGTKDGSA